MDLDKTWQECLKMYRYVAKYYVGGGQSVTWWKNRWLDKHGYTHKNDNIPYESCFFCEFAEGGCDCCPARLVEPGFDCGRKPCWFMDPKGFYLKLRRLQYKRLKGQK